MQLAFEGTVDPIDFNELAKEMNKQGYKITPRTIKKYTFHDNLMSDTVKVGGYRKGVKNVFTDKEEAISRLRRILELRAKGYSIFQILLKFENEEAEVALRERKKDLSRYVERNGHYYYLLEKKAANSGLYYFGDSLVNICKDFIKDTKDHYVNIFKSLDDIDKIEKHCLFQPLYMYKENLACWHNPDTRDDFGCVDDWCALKQEFDIGWETLKDLRYRHVENLETSLYLPEIDGERFNTEIIEWKRQVEINKLGLILFRYIEDIQFGRRVFVNDARNYVSFEWDSEYRDIDSFIKDFMKRKCAFVPSIARDMGVGGYFLKRF